MQNKSIKIKSMCSCSFNLTKIPPGTIILSLHFFFLSPAAQKYLAQKKPRCSQFPFYFKTNEAGMKSGVDVVLWVRI